MKINIWIVAVLLLVVAAVSGLTGFLLAHRQAMPAWQYLMAQPTVTASHDAYQAYRKQKPEVAIPILESFASNITVQLSLPMENPWCPRQTLLCDLRLTHARIARLYESLGDPRSAEHLRRALQISESFDPPQHLNRELLFRVLDMVDEDKNPEANHVPEDTARRLADPQH